MRTHIVLSSLAFVHRRGTGDASGWGPKIHDFVKKLESELWRRASSRVGVVCVWREDSSPQAV